MPIHEYRCQGCQAQFEALVRSDTVPACPNCHSTALEKLLSVFATATSPAKVAPSASPCSSCGNFRGPGACSLN